MGAGSRIAAVDSTVAVVQVADNIVAGWTVGNSFAVQVVLEMMFGLARHVGKHFEASHRAHKSYMAVED